MRRNVPLLLVVLVAAPGLAGCMTAQATAMRHTDTAEDRARQWDPAAELAGIFGVEGTWRSGWMGPYFPYATASYGWESGGGFGGGSGGGSNGGADAWDPGSAKAQSSHPAAKPYWSRTADDGDVGDGRCEFWVYAFVAEGREEAYFVVVDRDGDILDEGAAERDDDLRPVGEWNIDSDRALDIAKENNQGLRQGLDSENFSVVSVLNRDAGEDHATWTIVGAGGDASGGGGGMVVIDAVTGQVLRSHGGFGSP